MKVAIRYAAMALLLITAIAGSFLIPRRNLRSIGQVAGIALDEENGRLKATFELYTPALDEPIGRRRQTVVSYGESLEECISNARLIRGETLFTDDAAALILSSEDHAFLLQKVVEYYRVLENDQMDLPVFFSFGQQAAAIYAGEGAVISTELAESGKKTERLQTIRDLMNGTGERILIRGEGGYEIIS